MATREAYKGSRFSIELHVTDDGVCPVGDYLDALGESGRRKIDVLFERLGDHGKIANKEKFKKLEGTDGVFEFKSHQIRLLCFFTNDRRVIVCRGVTKKRDKHDSADIEHAIECWRAYNG